MRTRGGAAVAVAAVLLVGGCGDTEPAAEPGASPTPGSSSPTRTVAVQELELGKSDLALEAGLVRSPAGFAPVVELEVPAGWTSVHRYADAFDLGQADPTADAPLVVVAVTTPPEADARAALAAVAARQPAADVTRGSGVLLGSNARTLLVAHGDGPAYSSRDGSVALDAVDGYQLRLTAADLEGAPVVVAVLLVDDERTADLLAQADALLGSLHTP